MKWWHQSRCVFKCDVVHHTEMEQRLTDGQTDGSCHFTGFLGLLLFVVVNKKGVHRQDPPQWDRLCEPELLIYKSSTGYQHSPHVAQRCTADINIKLKTMKESQLIYIFDPKKILWPSLWEWLVYIISWLTESRINIQVSKSHDIKHKWCSSSSLFMLYRSWNNENYIYIK